MLVRICDITATTRHVELPKKCPACRKNLVEVGELDLGDGCIDGTLTTESPDDIAEFEPDAGSSWEYGDRFIVVGYRCWRCRHVLVEGEFDEVDGD